MDHPVVEPIQDDDEAAAEAPPWAEARGPHLPDAITSIHWLALVFVGLALLDVVRLVTQSGLGPTAGIPEIASFVTGAIASLVAFLLPAALLARHPDAPRYAPVLVAGTVLFALAEALRIVAEPLQPFFEQITPATEDLLLVPSSAAFSVAVSVVAAAGLACIGLGLARARRYEDRPGFRIGLLVPIVAIFATISGVYAVLQIDLGDIQMSPGYAVYLGAIVAVGIVRMAAWGYVTATAIGGSAAMEEPRTAWRLAALGGGLVLFAIVLSSVLGWLRVQDDSLLWLAYLTSIIFAIGYLSLLAGFVLGLPAIEPVETVDDEGVDEGVDDDVAEDELGWPIAGVPGR